MLLVGWGSTYGPIHDAVKRRAKHGEKIARHPFASYPSVAERPRKDLRQIQAHRRRRDERPGRLRLRPARHDPPRPLLRTEDREPDQDRRPHLPGQRNPGTASSKAAPSPTKDSAQRPGDRTRLASCRRDSPSTSAVTAEAAAAQVSAASDRAGDNTPTKPGTEAAAASAGENESLELREHPMPKAMTTAFVISYPLLVTGLGSARDSRCRFWRPLPKRHLDYSNEHLQPTSSYGDTTLSRQSTAAARAPNARS